MNNTALQTTQQSVLVVDDDEFSRDALRKRLVTLGVTDIHMARDGADGLRVFDALARTPDFLVCDIFMPDMDGVEFVIELAKRKYPGGLMLITGVSQDMLAVAQQIAIYRGLNVLGIFTKPVHQEALEQVMVLNRKTETPDPDRAAVSKDIFDLAGALARVGDDRKMLDHFLHMFRECNSNTVARIGSAMAAQQVELARRHAHSLKGGAGTVGLVGLEVAAGRLEDSLSQQLGGIDNPIRRNVDFAALTSAWAQAQQALAVLLDGLAA